MTPPTRRQRVWRRKRDQRDQRSFRGARHCRQLGGGWDTFHRGLRLRKTTPWTWATLAGKRSSRESSKEVDILLVIDRSGSMSATPGGFATDKWTALKTALPAALDPVKGGISFGMELFPNNLTTPIPVSCTSECWDMPAGETAIVVPRWTRHHHAPDHRQQAGRSSLGRNANESCPPGGVRLLHRRLRKGARGRQVRASRDRRRTQRQHDCLPPGHLHGEHGPQRVRRRVPQLLRRQPRGRWTEILLGRDANGGTAQDDGGGRNQDLRRRVSQAPSLT